MLVLLVSVERVIRMRVGAELIMPTTRGSETSAIYIGKRCKGYLLVLGRDGVWNSVVVRRNERIDLGELLITSPLNGGIFSLLLPSSTMVDEDLSFFGQGLPSAGDVAAV